MHKKPPFQKEIMAEKNTVIASIAMAKSDIHYIKIFKIMMIEIPVMSDESFPAKSQRKFEPN